MQGFALFYHPLENQCLTLYINPMLLYKITSPIDVRNGVFKLLEQVADNPEVFVINRRHCVPAHREKHASFGRSPTAAQQCQRANLPS